MKKKKLNIDPRKLKIIKQIESHRKKLGLTQQDVADVIGKDVKTYQRFESTGNGSFNVFDILDIFKALDFYTIEIIDSLGLPSLELSEVKSIYRDKNTLKSIEESGICRYVSEQSADMDDFTIASLLDILSRENLKRHQHKNPSSCVG